MIKTILVPVDGSGHAKKAVGLAADLAAKYGARVLLLHVLLRGHMPEGLMKAAQVEFGSGRGKPKADNLVNIPQEIMARVEGKHGTQVPLEVLEYLGKAILSGAEEFCRKQNVKHVERLVEEGNPAEIILSVAKARNADMIVMGTRGLSSLRGLVVGSVSQKVGQLAPCTCVTVR